MTIKAYWYKSVPNFGDFITPELIQHYGGKPEWSPTASAALVSTGSILELTPPNYSGCILGSGYILESTPHTYPNARVVGVRGELSKAKIKRSDVVLGDPGLLISNMYEEQDKTHLLGIIPHYVDKDNTGVKWVCEKYSEDIKLINVQLSPKEVFEEISKCQYILSSSLHGVIAADSIGIPNGWLSLSDKVIGNGFKFYDHFTVSGSTQSAPHNIVGTESLQALINMTQVVSSKVIDVQGKLGDKYSETIKEFI